MKSTLSEITNFSKSKKIQDKLHKLVPAGSHTYSKGEDQFPELAPQIMKCAKGAYCWDIDDNKYIDWAMGNRVIILGHCNETIDNYVIEQLKKGTNFTKPGILEYELAEYLVDLIPFADMVKFGKNGSDVTTAAVRLSRAYTGRKYIAICKQQPFFSTHDWFIGSTAMNAGVPEEVSKLTLGFDYNDIQSVEKLYKDYPGQIAALVLEPVKFDEPKNGFLQELRNVATKNGSVLIFDEMISGIRFDLRGAHNIWGVYPDLATYGKAIANGYSFSLLAGKKEIMELGGIKHNKERVFLLSQTHSSETVGLSAALATLKECQRLNVTKHIWDTGEMLVNSFKNIASVSGVKDYIRIIGFNCSPHIMCTKASGEYWPELHTLFHQEVIKHGILIPWISITYSHKEEELRYTLDVFSEVMEKLNIIIHNNEIDKYLVGSPVKPVFRKYNY